ncbi:Threonine/homoserine efflux transporter RhtA [Cognatiyoonia koreensis]|uniref:Threonine/homoserine efflux transporter RhtA n=1 Tax=Cognatiyoonia koreensis TaxID=364200 RepID=A0A1I0RL17_9RHOB|nr:DMT family transporter [Cognatiyoonia koreensis]SEW41026.1 Threonine/homoserine efflux transporter RhtA [Cognatiyoonia koreensis]
MTSQSTLLVAAMVVTAMFLIVGGDAAGTVMTRDGVSPFFVAWSRFAVAAVILLPLVGIQRADLVWDWRLVFRASLIATAICCILTALKTEEVANVFGAFFVGPLVAYTLSVILLRETSSLPRVMLLGLGFAGVLLVVKPGFGMTIGLGLAVLAGVLHGGYLVATRWMARDYRPRFLLWSQLLIGAVILAPFGATQIPALDTQTIQLTVISALGSAIGNLLLVLANRRAPATTIAPLIYSQLIHATLLGWLVFGDLPDGLSLLGLLVILCSGLATIWVARKG